MSTPCSKPQLPCLRSPALTGYWENSMTKQYDVIICGGGPSGSTAGLALAKQGYSVAVLDRATFPRKKLCGGLLTWKSVQLLKEIYGDDVDSLIESGVINYISDQFSISTYKTTLAQGDLPYPMHFVDRTVFDHYLIRKAQRAGVELFENARVTDCNPIQGIVTLDDGRAFHGRYILGADGANSVVRNSFPNLDRARFQHCMAPTIEISLKPEDFPRPVTHPELIVGFLDAGYGWVFPNKDRVIVGICGLRHKKENYSEIFAQYLDFLGIHSQAVPTLHGHPLPYGNYLENPVFENALLAGDAGGLVEPLFGEGIFFALCSGLYAGEAIAEGLTKRTHPGPIYSCRLHRQIIPELKASNRLRWILFSAMKWLGPNTLRIFVNAGTQSLAKMVHGMKSYSFLLPKHWDFLE